MQVIIPMTGYGKSEGIELKCLELLSAFLGFGLFIMDSRKHDDEKRVMNSPKPLKCW